MVFRGEKTILVIGKTHSQGLALSRCRGMTLIEITITLVIVALTMALIVPMAGQTSRSDSRVAASQLAMLVKHTYEEAILLGELRRMKLKPKTSSIEISSAPEDVRFDPRQGRYVGVTSLWEVFAPNSQTSRQHFSKVDVKGPSRSSEETSQEPDIEQISALSQFMSGHIQQAQQKNLAGETKTIQLPASIHVMDVWLEGMDKAEKEKPAWLYFFPSGYTQKAEIHLETKAGQVVTLQISALTGRVHIKEGYHRYQAEASKRSFAHER